MDDKEQTPFSQIFSGSKRVTVAKGFFHLLGKTAVTRELWS